MSEAKLNKGTSDIRAKSYPAKLPICKKKLKENIGLGILSPAFNPSTQKSEAGRFLSSSLAWSISEFQNSQAAAVKKTIESTKLLKMYLNKGFMFSPQETAELGSFGHVVLALG